MLVQAHRFFRRARPGQRSGLEPLVEQKEAVALPEECLDPVPAPAAEQKQDVFLERIQVVLSFKDSGQAFDPTAEIRIAADNDDL